MADGVEGIIGGGATAGGLRFRGEAGLRTFGKLVKLPKLGELLRSACRRSGSKTDVRTGEGGGKASSSGLRGVRTLLGEPEGLLGRSCGE